MEPGFALVLCGLVWLWESYYWPPEPFDWQGNRTDEEGKN